MTASCARPSRRCCSRSASGARDGVTPSSVAQPSRRPPVRRVARHRATSRGCGDTAARARDRGDCRRWRRRRPHGGNRRLRAAYGARRCGARTYRTREALRSRRAAVTRDAVAGSRRAAVPALHGRSMRRMPAPAPGATTRSSREERRSSATRCAASAGATSTVRRVEPSDAQWRYRRKLTLHSAATARVDRRPASVRRSGRRLRPRRLSRSRTSASWRCGASCAPRSTLLPAAPALRVAVRLLDEGAAAVVVEGGKCVAARRSSFFARCAVGDGALVAAREDGARRVASPRAPRRQRRRRRSRR